MKQIYALIFFVCLGLFSSIHSEEAPFTLSSTAFQNNQMIPLAHACALRGGNTSPELRWKNPPKDTKSFALAIVDVDAPNGHFVHWLLFNIPAKTDHLSEGIDRDEQLPDGSRQGINHFEQVGYDGPCPPPEKLHRYIFTLYALDSMLNLDPRIDQDEFNSAIQGHVIGKASLTGLFKTSKNKPLQKVNSNTK